MSNAPASDESVGRVHAAVMAALRDQTDAAPSLERVCRACVALLPVDGASISLMTSTRQRETLYASDEVITRIEALQYTLGEGPCFEAFNTLRPVLVPDLPGAGSTSWPVFAAEIADQPVGAIFAFPLHSGAITIGAMDLYRREPGWLTTDELAIALEVVDIAAAALLGLRLGGEDGEWWLALPRNREQVHQATGMLIAEFGIPADQAMARLRGYAFGRGRLVDEVARDLVARRLAPGGIDL